MRSKKMHDEVGSFYVVLRPTPLSTLGDIFFLTSVEGIMLQAMGGLRSDEVFGVYRSRKKAEQLAKDLLATKG